MGSHKLTPGASPRWSVKGADPGLAPRVSDSTTAGVAPNGARHRSAVRSESGARRSADRPSGGQTRSGAPPRPAYFPAAGRHPARLAPPADRRRFDDPTAGVARHDASRATLPGPCATLRGGGLVGRADRPTPRITSIASLVPRCCPGACDLGHKWQEAVISYQVSGVPVPQQVSPRGGPWLVQHLIAVS